MPRAQKQPAQVRHDQADKTDDAGNRHATRRDSPGRQQKEQARPGGGKPQVPGGLIPQGKHVQLPPEQEGDGAANDQARRQQDRFAPAASLKAAHDPEDYARDRSFVQGFDQGDEGRQKSGHHHAGKHQRFPSEAAANAAQGQNRAKGGRGPGKGGQGQAKAHEGPGQAKADGQGRAESGPAGNAQSEGIGQRVTQNALKNRAGHGQPGPGGQRQKGARQAQIRQHQA